MAPTVLLVEDNPDHAVFTLKVLRNDPPTAQVIWAKDGEEALAFLERGQHATEGKQGPRPEMILLDIHLPKLGGHEVLRRVKRDERLKTIPVIMLTTSESFEDVVESYGAGANSYIAKPVSHSEFRAHIKTVKEYWLITNKAPAA
jgi:two-component system response regulator